jgi:hypothetical protein
MEGEQERGAGGMEGNRDEAGHDLYGRYRHACTA